MARRVASVLIVLAGSVVSTPQPSLLPTQTRPTPANCKPNQCKIAGRCVDNGEQYVHRSGFRTLVTCLFCNFTASPISWSHLPIGAFCDNGKPCDGSATCQLHPPTEGTTCVSEDIDPCSQNGTCANTCTDHPSKPGEFTCIAEQQKCNYSGFSPTCYDSSCLDGQCVATPKLNVSCVDCGCNSSSVCQNSQRCQTATLPPGSPKPDYFYALMGATGGALVLILFVVFLYCHRRWRIRKQSHNTFYTRVPEFDDGEVRVINKAC